MNEKDTFLKVLFLNNYLYPRGGSEKVMFEEMRLLDQAGEATAAFSRAHEKNLPSVFHRFFPPQMETERMSLSPQSLLAVKELIYSHAARSGFAEVINRTRPDIIHAHNVYGRLTTSTLDEAQARGIPVVMTLHDLKLLCPSYLMLNHGQVCERCKGGLYHKAVLSRCHKNSYLATMVYAFEAWFNNSFQKYDSISFFIAPSRFLRNKCIDYGWPADRIVHVPNFIDTCSLQPSFDPGKYLLYLGRLSPEKGVETLLKALSGGSTDCQLLVAGEGPERARLETFALEHNLNVRFTGHLSGQRLHDALANAKSIVMPSECYENAPLSLLEAFAHGKPVVGSRLGGISEMIDDGVDGFLFEPGSVEALRETIEHLLALPSQSIVAMGRSAREKVGREYSAENHYKNLTRVYSMAMGGACV